MAGIQRFLSYQRACAHTHTHVHAHTCAHACTHMCAYAHGRMQACAHTHTCAHARTQSRAHTHMHAHTYVHVCTHTRTCTHVRAHLCTHIHAHACTCMRAHAYTHTGTHTPGGLWRVPGASASAPQGSRGWPASVPSLPGEVAFTQWLVRAEASGHSHGLRVLRPPGACMGCRHVCAGGRVRVWSVCARIGTGLHTGGRVALEGASAEGTLLVPWAPGD